jgi:hypothetical protein
MSALHSGMFLCYILEQSDAFHVDILASDTVSDLKDAILSKNPNTFVGVDAYQLKVWKVCAFELPNLNQVLKADKRYMLSTKALKTQLANLQLSNADSLEPTSLLSSTFHDAHRGCLLFSIVPVAFRHSFTLVMDCHSHSPLAC